MPEAHLIKENISLGVSYNSDVRSPFFMAGSIVVGRLGVGEGTKISISGS